MAFRFVSFRMVRFFRLFCLNRHHHRRRIHKSSSALPRFLRLLADRTPFDDAHETTTDGISAHARVSARTARPRRTEKFGNSRKERTHRFSFTKDRVVRERESGNGANEQRTRTKSEDGRKCETTRRKRKEVDGGTQFLATIGVGKEK